MPPRRLVAGAEHSGEDQRQDPTRHKLPSQTALQQILDVVGQQGSLGMWAEDVAVPPDGEWRAERCVHKQARCFGFFPLPSPPNRKAELRGSDAEGFSGPRLLLADDFLHGQ